MLSAVQMTTFRIIQIFVVQLGLGIFYLILGAKIMKRDKKKLNWLVFGFYLFIFISMLMNVIYANFQENPLVKNLHFLTLFFSFTSYVFLVIFNLILLKSEMVFNKSKQILVFLFYMIINALNYFLVENNLTMDESNGWYPQYNLTFFISSMTLLLLAVIPMLVFAIQIYKKFGDKELKNRWISYVIGLTFMSIAGAGILVSNYLFNDTFRNLWTLISLVLVITAVTLVYKGLARQLAKKKSKKQ